MTIIDAQQRQAATDPTQSFLVQAPAGSGKTEMLSQRFLRLLSTVKEPEQIIALTFTRKAASEMRERIILALQKAADGEQPESEHQQQTYQFAQAAIAQNERYQWHLLAQPARLKVMTIDALCQSICQAMPVQEKAIPFASITEKTVWYCQKAARECIEYALHEPNWHESMASLLLHLDNRVDRLIDLFADMLQQREQWIHLVLSAQSTSKTEFEQALALIEQHAINRFVGATPEPIQRQLQTLACHAACLDKETNSPRAPLKDWHNFELLNREILHGLASLLLTGKDALRKQFDHHVGISKSSCPSEQTYQELKEASLQLLDDLKQLPDFRDALVRVRNLPPNQYDPNQWTILAHLLRILPLLAAHLQILFERDKVLDFSAVAQQAILALGDDQLPTDLALYWDNAIHHLLIDEFQDTSIQQYQLIEKLVAGWEKQSGKTLFCVGDPMQSIYRFRQAEVGLFLRARYHGIGPVSMQYLQLQMNFRSCHQIVTWFNQAFAPVFPVQEDIELGAIGFSASTPALLADQDSSIEALSYEDKEAEAQALLDKIKALRQHYPNDSIAILARSRNHLREILTLLRGHQIPFQGVDMDLLTTLPHIQDIYNLTIALLFPANKLSWFGMLRSPYCGVTLNDLLLIGKAARNRPIYDVLANLNQLQPGLTEDGLKRATYFFKIMSDALKQRYQKSLSLWVWETFAALKGPELLDSSAIADLEQYWQLLEKHDKAGLLDDLNYFREQLEALYAQQSLACQLQVMTIHKSKGLEFDTVILPQLSAKNASLDRPLLRWLKLPREQQAPLFLLAPVKATDQDNCPLYDFLTRLDQEKEQFERQRLLYVAITRAKKRLVLSGIQKVDKSSFQTLLNHIPFDKIELGEQSEQQNRSTSLFRIHTDLIDEAISQSHQQVSLLGKKEPVEWLASTIGSAVHLLLEQALVRQWADYSSINWHPMNHFIRQQVADVKKQQIVENHCRRLIEQFYQCPIGQWLITPRQQTYAEYAILIKQKDVAKQQIIDLFFYDESDGWWVIDYKTSAYQAEKHQEYETQVNQYAQALCQLLSIEKLNCGVYYLSDNRWVHWSFPFNREKRALA